MSPSGNSQGWEKKEHEDKCSGMGPPDWSRSHNPHCSCNLCRIIRILLRIENKLGQNNILFQQINEGLERLNDILPDAKIE